ncbi:MAG: hypothetical protein ACRECW_16560 [Phyllobacterium sp.]
MRTLTSPIGISLTAISLVLAVANARAQDGVALPDIEVPGLSDYASPNMPENRAIAEGAELILEAKLDENNENQSIERGLVWRIFGPEPGPDGKLPLLATAKGGTTSFHLEPGSYLVHTAYGRAGATKRITMTREPRREAMILDAGGLRLNAVLADGVRIPEKNLRFSIYEDEEDANGDRALIIPNVKPESIVRLNAGTYHVVSNYGSANAVIRADIRVEAGKMTEATVQHRAAQLTMKLVREAGGEALADTAWSVLTTSGDTVRESVGAFASMVLAEGEYVIIAKNKDRIYQRNYKVVGGRNQDVELLSSETLVESTD